MAKKIFKKIVKKKVTKKQNFWLVFVDSPKRFVKTKYKTKAEAEKAAKALAKKLNKSTYIYECEQGDFNFKVVSTKKTKKND